MEKIKLALNEIRFNQNIRRDQKREMIEKIQNEF